jgi:hypothetical protein
MHDLCIVVAYRNREQHLAEFIPHMRNYLKNAEILIVEQAQGKDFNRGKLFNIGFSHTHGLYNNYCFHDVDMLPIHADYSYSPNVTHLAVEVEQFGWKLLHERYFGGVTLFSTECFREINGFSNDYWGWGGEDDNLLKRCEATRVQIDRRPGRFCSLPHPRDPKWPYNPINGNKVQQFQSKEMKTDGLSNIQYKILNEFDSGHIVVDV